MTGFGLIKRKRLARLAVFALAIVHLGGVLAPHTASHSDATPIRPHWHAVGDPLEPVHDEAACPACSGLQLAVQPAAVAKLSILVPTVFKAPEAPLIPSHSAARYCSILSRAPPAFA